MKKVIGPHQRFGRRRRRLKAVVVCAIYAILVVMSSWTINTTPEPGKWDRPTIQDLVTARKAYELAGGPYGNAGILLDRYLRYGDYITGKVDDPRLCGPVWN